jgi:hypothetical protein
MRAIFQLLLSGDGGADLGEDGRDVGCRVVEAGAGVSDRDAHELDTSSISSEGAKREWYFSIFLVGFFAFGVHAEADLKEDKEAVLAVERVRVWSGVGWHYSGVDEIRGGTCSCRHQAIEVFL